jgi:hypothetical protein
MPLRSLTSKRVSQLSQEWKAKKEALGALVRTSPAKLWQADLEAFEIELVGHEARLAEATLNNLENKRGKKRKSSGGVGALSRMNFFKRNKV